MQISRHQIGRFFRDFLFEIPTTNVAKKRNRLFVRTTFKQVSSNFTHFCSSNFCRFQNQKVKLSRKLFHESNSFAEELDHNSDFLHFFSLTIQY